MKIPGWLKILCVLALLSLVFSVLGAVSEHFIAPVFLTALVLFPGRDKENPTLFKVIIWLWGLGFLAAIALLAGQFMGRPLLPAEADQPSQLELWSTIVFSPPLVWGFLRRERWFLPLLIGSTLLFMGIEIRDYTEREGLKAVMELVGNITAEAILAIYMFKRFVPARRKRRVAS